ncbi:MAG: TIGR01777 family protein [Nitrospira sp.]|nr:MAG: TIGR01777 family protein [Nitrospira sp.]
MVVSGGTGFIGRALCRSLARQGMTVTVLSRNLQHAKAVLDPAINVVEWNGVTSGTWEHELESTETVINLAGAPIAEGRWTPKRKQVIVDSRVNATRLLVQAISRLSNKPRLLISASGVGYYGTSQEIRFDERNGSGSDFFADLCVAWERAALAAQSAGVRVVRLRTGMVLEQDGGALAKMLPPFRAFVGGPIAPGTQWVSWIHRADLIGLIEWALTNSRVSGPVNAVAPEPVTMRELCRILGKVLHRPSWLPVPSFALRLAFGELASFMTTGQRVLPKAALDSGYQFKFPRLESALRSILFADTPASEVLS